MATAALIVVEKEGELRFRVHAKPRAKRSAVLGVRAHDGALEVALAAPPVDGEANAELVGLLTRALQLRKGDARIAHGEGSREKLVAVCGIDEAELRSRLLRAAK